jgi:hypothetical protein
MQPFVFEPLFNHKSTIANPIDACDNRISKIAGPAFLPVPRDFCRPDKPSPFKHRTGVRSKKGHGFLPTNIRAGAAFSARCTRWHGCGRADNPDILDLRLGAGVRAVGQGQAEFMVKLQGTVHRLF